MTLAAALELAEVHGLPVFPCRREAEVIKGQLYEAKSPLTDHGYKDATRNLDQIAKWWAIRPDALVAVATGAASGILVVDVDPDGLEWYRENARRLAAGRVHKTARGYHLLYRACGLGNHTGALPPGVDIRGDGGYVIWHPALGRNVVGDLDEIGELPQWVRDEIGRKSQRVQRPSVNGSNASPDAFGDRSRDLLKRVARDVRAGLADYEILARHQEHPHAREQTDAKRAVQRCIDKARESDRDAPEAEAAEAELLQSVRVSLLADLNAGPEAVDAAKAPEFIVENTIPKAGANLAGVGGAGKTTVLLNECIRIAIGSTLYGQSVLRSGPCVLVTAEDGAGYPRYILQRVLADAEAAKGLHRTHVLQARSDVRIVGWSRPKFGPIALVDRDGNVSRAKVFDLLLELLAPLKPLYVTLDPSVLFSPGERFGNDVDAFVAAMMHEAALQLGACAQLVDHVSQTVAREGIIDQHAARGGTAKTDNARLARQLLRVREDMRDVETALPPSLSLDEVREGKVLQLHWTKLNYAPLPPPAWLRRRGHWIEYHRRPSPDEITAARMAALEERTEADIAAILASLEAQGGRRISQRELEEMGVVGLDGRSIPRNRLRTAMSRARTSNRLRTEPLPEGERHGARREYLAIGPGVSA